MGTLTNIDQEGFASAAFHAFPDTMKHDPISGDFAPNFFGHALNTAAYLVKHPEFGWLAFGGRVEIAGSTVRLFPADSFRSRLYVAPLGLWLTLDAGTFEAIEIDMENRRPVRIALSKVTEFSKVARLRVEAPGREGRPGRIHFGGLIQHRTGRACHPVVFRVDPGRAGVFAAPVGCCGIKCSGFLDNVTP
ncbi:MAG: DUF5695 domain-containing protein [Marinilabiliales bacterium]|nr:DUF5695 domain-containing protein [Marinilabiliales bacterium]